MWAYQSRYWKVYVAKLPKSRYVQIHWPIMPEQKITAGQRLSPRTASPSSVSWWCVWITTSMSLVHDFTGASLCSLTLAVATFIFACVCILLWLTDLWNSCCFAHVWVPLSWTNCSWWWYFHTKLLYTLCSSGWFRPWSRSQICDNLLFHEVDWTSRGSPNWLLGS